MLESTNKGNTMAQRRRFSPEFKVEVVLELLKGNASQAEPADDTTWRRI